MQKVRGDLVKSNLDLQRVQSEAAAIREETDLIHNELENQRLDNNDLVERIKVLEAESNTAKLRSDGQVREAMNELSAARSQLSKLHTESEELRSQLKGRVARIEELEEMVKLGEQREADLQVANEKSAKL